MQRDLVERARAGDVDAFTLLVDGRLEGMFRTAMAILGREADARDATQEALTSIWRALPALREADRFDSWSRRILINACRMTVRRHRATVREIPVVSISDEETKTAPDAGPAEHVARLDLLERAFDRLAVEERALLVLHHLEDRPVAEISELLGVPEGTVKSRLHAARRSLERALERESR